MYLSPKPGCRSGSVPVWSVFVGSDRGEAIARRRRADKGSGFALGGFQMVAEFFLEAAEMATVSRLGPESFWEEVGWWSGTRLARLA